MSKTQEDADRYGFVVGDGVRVREGVTARDSNSAIGKRIAQRRRAVVMGVIGTARPPRERIYRVVFDRLPRETDQATELRHGDLEYAP